MRGTTDLTPTFLASFTARSPASRLPSSACIRSTSASPVPERSARAMSAATLPHTR